MFQIYTSLLPATATTPPFHTHTQPLSHIPPRLPAGLTVSAGICGGELLWWRMSCCITNPPLLLPANTPPTPLNPTPAGLAISAGFSGGELFVVAHELLHGSRLDRALCNLLLASVGYMHWSESHLAHHIKVCVCWEACAHHIKVCV